MNILVLYASKHGCTEKCAHLLAEKLGSAEVVNLRATASVSLDKYDTVVIGTSIYAGQVSKSVSQFCSQNLERLKSKRLGLFVCCANTEKALEQLEAGFPRELFEKAVAKGHFGYDFTRLGFLERLIVKAVSKQKELGSEIRYKNIEEFAKSVIQGE